MHGSATPLLGPPHRADEVDEALSTMCRAALTLGGADPPRSDEVAVEVDVAIEVVPSDPPESVRLHLLPTACAGGRRTAEFKMLQHPRAAWCVYEVAEHEDPGQPADVLIGFYACPSGRHDGVDGCLCGGSAATTTLTVELRSQTTDRVSYSIQLPQPEPGSGVLPLGPACLGAAVLPVVAMPACSGISVQADDASLRGRDVRIRAVCALLRADLQRAVASRRFALPPPSSHCAAALIPLCRADGPLHVLPDLGRGAEEALSRARTSRRHALLLRELMERAWAPRRVRSGAVDPDW